MTEMISEVKNLSYEEGVKVLQLPTLVHIQETVGDMIEAYKLTTGKDETGIAAILQFDEGVSPPT